MTPAFRPGNSPAHRLDPRPKLAFQVGFAVAAFAWSAPIAPVVLTGVVALVLFAARLSPVAALSAYRLPLVLLAASPVVEAAVPGPPWVDPSAGVEAAVASYRVVLVLAVGAAYVRTTPVAGTRAVVQRLVPGKAGRFLGAGVGLVLRFLPVLLADLRRVRDASRARLGDERSLARRMQVVATGGLRRAFLRADRLALALRARCFAWNPTPPRLSLSWRDVPVFGMAVVLAATPVL